MCEKRQSNTTRREGVPLRTAYSTSKIGRRWCVQAGATTTFVVLDLDQRAYQDDIPSYYGTVVLTSIATLICGSDLYTHTSDDHRTRTKVTLVPLVSHQYYYYIILFYKHV